MEAPAGIKAHGVRPRRLGGAGGLSPNVVTLAWATRLRENWVHDTKLQEEASVRSQLGVIPALLAVFLLIARWKSGAAFFEAVYGVPALAIYILCGTMTAGSTIALMGRKESNAAVVAVGFGIGTLVALAFDAWIGWRGVVFGLELAGFSLVLLTAPIWFAYSVRTPPEPVEEEPESEW
jgi:hypothetical protein